MRTWYTDQRQNVGNVGGCTYVRDLPIPCGCGAVKRNDLRSKRGSDGGERHGSLGLQGSDTHGIVQAFITRDSKNVAFLELSRQWNDVIVKEFEFSCSAEKK